MCKFSEENRVKLGNLAVYLATNTEMPSKTKLLKLIYLVEESFALKHHTPFWALSAGPYVTDDDVRYIVEQIRVNIL